MYTNVASNPLSAPVLKPINMKPMWAIALYAISLFTLVWFIAPKLPTIIDNKALTNKNGCSCVNRLENGPNNN